MTVAGGSCDLGEFRQNAAAHLDELARTGRVEALTVDGTVKGVVMAPHVFDRMVEQVERAETAASVRRGLADVAAGRVRPAEQVYRDLIAEFGLDPAIVYGITADGE